MECIVKRILVLLVALFATTPAFADGFYVGASVGMYAYEESVLEISDSSIGVYGGWKILPNLALEGQWIHWSAGSDSVFDPASGITVDLTFNSFDTLALYAKPSLRVSDSFDLYAKLGFAQMTGDFEATITTPCCCPGCVDVQNLAAEDSETDVIWGAGGEFNMANSFSIRAEVVGFEVFEEGSFTYLLSGHYRFN